MKFNASHDIASVNDLPQSKKSNIYQLNDQNLDYILHFKSKIIKCNLTSVEKQYYNSILESNNTENDQDSEILKLFEHPYLIRNAEKLSIFEEHNSANDFKDLIFSSSKMSALDNLFYNLPNNNKRIIIITKIHEVISILKYYMKYKNLKNSIFDGNIRGNQRQEIIDTFNSKNSDVHVLLMIPNECLRGINLSSADLVIFYDNEIDTKREGQILQNFNIKKDVIINHLITNNHSINGNNIDEYIIKVQISKSEQNHQLHDVQKQRLIEEETLNHEIMIPFIDLNNGKPNFPLIIDDNFHILSIGEIVSRDNFHSEKYIYPSGYCAKRLVASVKEPNEKVWYLLKIIDKGCENPIFRIEMEDDNSVYFEDSQPSNVCIQLNKNIQKGEKIDQSGPAFFGLTIPVVQYLIQSLDGVDKLPKYQKKKFVMQNKKKKLTFKIGGACTKSFNYTIDINYRLKEIKEEYVDKGEYFIINRSHQIGKTTTLRALMRYLKSDYFIFYIDFQSISNDKYNDNDVFMNEFLSKFMLSYKKYNDNPDMNLIEPIIQLQKCNKKYRFDDFFDSINDICKKSSKPLVLIIDEFDTIIKNTSMTNDFLSISRSHYQDRDITPTFHSVILSGVRDIDHIRSMIHKKEEFTDLYSHWNIYKKFSMNMLFSVEQIESMLEEYERDNKTGMNIKSIAQYIHDYTKGHPFLVSAICKIIDEELSKSTVFKDGKQIWSIEGVSESVTFIINNKIPFFVNIIEKLNEFPKMREILKIIVFKNYKKNQRNVYEECLDIGEMFGLINTENGNVVISNHMIEMIIIYYFIDKDTNSVIQDRSPFFKDGALDMETVLNEFISYYEINYGNKKDSFIEEKGIQIFITFLRPIISSEGNFYIEEKVSDGKSVDLIVDYHGIRHLIELKFIEDGSHHLIGYLNKYNLETGFIIIYNSNKKNQSNLVRFEQRGKTIIKVIL